MHAMTILFVDDEVNILKSFVRNLRSEFNVEICDKPEDALKMIKAGKKYAVVVSDYNMPGMDGIEFLKKVHDAASDTVRVMLTGKADLNVSMKAVNEGHIFRFLTKPCEKSDLVKTLNTCIDQYKMIIAEKELLKGTLQGSVKVLTDVLSILSPKSFGKAERLKRYTGKVVKRIGLKNSWQVELASMLSQIGCAALPKDILEKSLSDTPLSKQEQAIYDTHPQIAHKLLSNIPRMNLVADIIVQLYEPMTDETAYSVKVLKAIYETDLMISGGLKEADAVYQLSNSGKYDSKLVKAIEVAFCETEGYIKKKLMISGLKENMIVVNDIKTNDGLLLLSKGQVFNDASISRLVNYGKSCGVAEPIDVMVPSDMV